MYSVTQKLDREIRIIPYRIELWKKKLSNSLNSIKNMFLQIIVNGGNNDMEHIADTIQVALSIQKKQ